MKNKEKQERVCVHTRLRPFTEDELKIDRSSPIEQFDTINNIITIRKDNQVKNFNFDSLINTKVRQQEVFEKSAKDVVDSFLKGYNGTIFAYGQTGTGKTFTMVGNYDNEEEKGIIPRSFDHIFESIKDDKEYKHNIHLSFIQIYLETIQDLLEPENENIRIREDTEQGVYLDGVQWIKVKNPQECQAVFQCGERNRVTASTKMNAHSSRSHAIIIVRIERSLIISPEKIKILTNESNEKILNERVMTRSMLYLVDLAGSERVKKTKAEAMRLEEAKKINYSLLILGNCIQSLTDPKSKHISYRDSKLTRLLQDSLGGNAKTSLIVTISPSSFNLDESYGTLLFGSRAMKVQNKAIINKTIDYQALSIKLQDDLDKLNDEYSKLKIDYEKIIEENKKYKLLDPNINIQKINILNETNDDINDTETKFKNEIKKLEKHYKDLLSKREKEQEKILIDVDKILYEREIEIDELKTEKDKLNDEYTKLKYILKDFEIEKEDFQKSIIELSNANNELRNQSFKDLLDNYTQTEISNKTISTIDEYKTQLMNYEEEMKYNKKTLEILNEGTSQIVEEKKELIKKLKSFDKVKQRDSSTGTYLIKDYLHKTSNFMDHIFRILTKDD